jgi:hypothetical protein
MKTSNTTIDWDAAIASLSVIPQDKHADYFAMLASGKAEIKQAAKEVKAKVVTIGAKIEKTRSSNVQDKAKEAKSSTRAKSAKKKIVPQKRAMINGVSISYHQYSMLQTLRDLVTSGVNGADGLSSTEIAEYRGCGEQGTDVSVVFDRLKAQGLIDWRLVEMKGKSPDWPAGNLPSHTKRREFVLMEFMG